MAILSWSGRSERRSEHHPLTFKFDADNEIKPEKPAPAVDAAPKFNDPLRVSVQSPFVGSSYAMITAVRRRTPPRLAEGKPSKGHDAASSPHQGLFRLLPATPEPKATADRESVPGIVLVDAIATNRNTFFEFGTGKQRAGTCRSAARTSFLSSGAWPADSQARANADEMMSIPIWESAARTAWWACRTPAAGARVVRSGG